jgi:hypothetical protein
VWFYEGAGAGRWRAFEARENARLEAAFSAANGDARVSVDGRRYVVDVFKYAQGEDYPAGPHW